VPWSLADARLTVSTTAVGVSLLAWGWWVASGTPKAGSAVPGVAASVVAALAVAGGALSWVTAGRRSNRLRREALLARLDAYARDDVSPQLQAKAEVGLVALAGSARFHRADCVLVRGKAVHRFDGRSTAGADRTPCEMCEP
jgi:HAMP domain-containing protein